MNIYEKIQLVKEEILESNLKKSGENKFAGFKYYELADFLPTIIKLCNNNCKTLINPTQLWGDYFRRIF